MNKPQKLVVHVHSARKLFHVSVHNEDSRTNVGWKTAAAKSRWAYEQTLQGMESSTRALCGGLMMAFVNTDYEGWETVEVAEIQPNLARALEKKDALIQEYEAQGLTNVGVRSISSKRDPSNDGLGAKWTARFNPNRMTMGKVNEKIDFINTSLQLTISREIRSRAVRSVIGEKGNVSNMAQLLRFIRNEMGLV